MKLNALLTLASGLILAVGFDLVQLAAAFATQLGQPTYNVGVDFNHDDWVDGSDLSFLAAFFGLSGPGLP